MYKILLFLKLPPPVTGATLMNKFLCESELINKNVILKSIYISYKESVEKTSIFYFKKIKVILVTYFSLIKSLLAFKPDLVYFQISPFGLAFFRDCTYSFIIKLFNIQVIYHIHGKGIQKYIGKSKIKFMIYKWVFKNNYIICLAESLLYDVEDIYNNRPYVINNAIPINLSVIDSQIVTNKINILFFSNLMRSKGIYDFLDSIVYYNKYYNNSIINVVIAGHEADISKETIENEIKKRNLSNKTIYIGAKYDKEKLQVFLDSHIFVFPTFHYNEAFPLVLIEAMQAGLPVIATREGAIPEIIDDGITGYLVDKHRPDQIAGKLELLIKNPELRINMGEAARKKFLEKYTLDIFEKNMLNVFNDVIAKTKS